MSPSIRIGAARPRRGQLLLAMAMAMAAAGCVERPNGDGRTRTGAGPGSAAGTAPRVTIRSALTAPPSWVNLWGSWPFARFDHAASYDSDRHLTVMFGGRPSATELYGDTWEWDGGRTQWVERTPSVEGNGPPARAGHAMVYDAGRQRTLLVGGWQPGTGLFASDQWEWSSVDKTWQERAVPGPQPGPRYGHAMAYDSDRARVMLFGGFGGTGSAKARFADLWEWDGTAGAWTDRTPAAGNNPSARMNALMVYDQSRKVIVLRGGNTGTAAPPGGTNVDETWEWDVATATWALRTPPALGVSAGAMASHRAVYDSGRGKVILFQDYLNVWQWDPVTPAWTPITTSKADTLLPPASGPALFYDASRARIGIFGGASGRTRDVWELDPADGTWANRSVPIDGPVQRTWPFVAVDSKRDALMVFGGQRTSDPSPYKQDIWQWRAAAPDWDASITTLAGAKPSARAYGPMVYDPLADRLLLFGGYGGSYLNDVWAWAPATRTWAALAVTGTLPPPRSNHLGFHDRARNKLISYGGYSAANAQIWELDLAALTWSNWTPSPNPVEITARFDDDVALDPDRKKLILIGGAMGSPNGVTDAAVWEWDLAGHFWALRAPAPGSPVPPGRSMHAIAYDTDRRVVIVVGGRSAPNALLDDSWEWDGARAMWTETTPAVVRPLPRAGHRLLYDEARRTALLYGGTVPSDTAYGDREIWEYVPDRAPRPDGASCSVSASAACASGFCVDGVCCQTSTCAGTCRACNVAGHEGTCADVPVGGVDDACAAEQACDAAHQCKSRDGQACGSFSDCASGHCADGLCCDGDCNGSCMACNLNGRRGVCSNVSLGLEDAVGAPACVSDAVQARACNGQGTCALARKANGDACTAATQCTSGFCIDGVCCNSACVGTCQACNLPAAPGTCTPVPTGQSDPSASAPCVGPMQYCRAGVCATDKKPTGAGCLAAGDCGSGFCVDGVCCDAACTGACLTCSLPGQIGRCGATPNGVPDGNAATPCLAPQFCVGGACAGGLKEPGVRCGANNECGTGFCVDGVCCDGACAGTCRACNLPGIEGTCALLPPGAVDASATPACAAPNYCAAGGNCVAVTGRKPNGAACSADSACGSSNCVDGVCCESACAGRCRSCQNATGTCGNAPDGEDPRADCTGVGVCGGTCNGRGSCRFAAASIACREPGCQSDGYIGGPGLCDGAGRCGFSVVTDCHGYVCVNDSNGVGACRTDCTADPHCLGGNYCEPGQCLADRPNGRTCDRDSQCTSGFCADGYCCDQRCGTCGSCNLPGQEGTCNLTPAGTDPGNECIDSASDPSRRCGGVCNGRGSCEFPATGTACGTCKTCDGSGKCAVKPEDDPACGDIDCDQLDTSCRDYRDLTTARCASLGACKVANAPATCTTVLDTCGPDAGGAGGADGAGGGGGTATDAGGTDGGPPPRSGGGGCGCAVSATGSDATWPLALAVLVAWAIGSRRRRQT